MKKCSHSVTSPWHSTITKKKALWVGSALSGALLVTGCQSTSLAQSKATNQTPAAAKTALANALQKQRRQSFSYHSNIEINNEQQFIDVDHKQLVTSEYVGDHCKDTHDKAYAALLARAEAQNKSLDGADFAPQRSAIKNTYLNCHESYQAWRDGQYDSRSKDNVETNAISPYYQQLFDSYGDRPTSTDIKKAQLLDAYLLQPMSINAQGVYQPMAGKATMLASVQYQARNHRSSINQPIYIDFKKGLIYFWADNFAMLSSELLDDKLGIKWRNKWLKIALDDGTLPKGFGRQIIKTHFETLDHIFASAPVEQFDYVAPNTLTSLTPRIPKHQLPVMLASEQVIRRSQSAEDYEQFYRDYMQLFYERISKQYPELVTSAELKKQADHITDAKKTGFTSKAMVQQALVMMKNMIDKGSTPTDLLPKSALSDSVIQELYGFDKRGQLKWQHTRSNLPNRAMSSHSQRDAGLVIDVLQQYTTIGAQEVAFPNLAHDMQVPNASNSIDLREYGQELVEYYQEGNGTMMGKMMFSVMPTMKQ
ncbi:hypothetical protein J3492_07890 [Psychrobacter sp. F1192]|uniref:Lipoprotein n=1 Tax=Psychrobacter coccoides TaxID=2818440 RepID=A0ABS3NP01_9GAMM|nr:hypothetical protein [Psychrobacter coccoides]MBO1531137.1 hypothetical protein [Psychrobacter coccoides]